MVVYVTLEVGMIITFPPALESILGLRPQQNPMVNDKQEITSFKSNFACDSEAGIHALYVYCDLLHFSHVGDIKALLLRVVSSGGVTGDVIARYYEHPRYVPL